jgi:tetratricopeptide (TPR) repeat protein
MIADKSKTSHLLVAVVLLSPALTGWAQHGNHTAAPAAAKQKPVVLQTGLGKIQHLIQTTSPVAQQFFNQGLMLIYGFNHDEAIRSFEKAASLDPAAAMPHWGIALALGPNINMDVDPQKEKAAFDAVQKALRLSAKSPENEKAYIAALVKRYSDDPKADLKKLAHDYADAMRELSRTYPDDMDAATLFAESLMDLNPWRLWTKDGKPAEKTEEIVATLERVLRRDPDHIGANHYYIHAIEASKHPERALPAADRLGKLAPAAGHLTHMPGHIYLQLGDYERTAAGNEAAARADRQFIAASGATGIYPMMYYTHNLHFIAVARAAQGRYLDAKRAAVMMRENVQPAVKEMPMIEPYTLVDWLVMLQFHKWDEFLTQAKPAEEKSQGHLVWQYGRALSLAGKGKTAEAEEHRNVYAKIVSEIPPDAPYGTTNTAREAMTVGVHVADAAIAESRNDLDAAIGHWRKAVEAEDALAYDEPPAWYYPVRQSLGGALLKAKKYTEAEVVFREALDAHPRDGRLLFGLLEALNGQNKKTAAAQVKAQYDEAWKSADTKLKISDL